MVTTQINFKSHRGVYVKHTMADTKKGSRRRRVVMTRMTLPAARSAAKIAASTAHLSATAGGVSGGGGGTLASTLARPVTLASSGLSTLGHAAATGLQALAYTLHHGEEPHGLHDAPSQKAMACRRNNVCVATAKGAACDQAADGGFILVCGSLRAGLDARAAGRALPCVAGEGTGTLDVPHFVRTTARRSGGASNVDSERARNKSKNE